GCVDVAGRAAVGLDLARVPVGNAAVPVRLDIDALAIDDAATERAVPSRESIFKMRINDSHRPLGLWSGRVETHIPTIVLVEGGVSIKAPLAAVVGRRRWVEALCLRGWRDGGERAGERQCGDGGRLDGELGGQELLRRSGR